LELHPLLDLSGVWIACFCRGDQPAARPVP
jgi:hypothetical protein